MIRPKRRRMTPYRAAWLTDRAEDSASFVAAYVFRKAADPLPTDYADLGVDLLSVSFSGVKLTDVYAATVGAYL